MDYVFTFTPSQLFGSVVVFCAGLVTISSAVTVLIGGFRKAKMPENIQNERIETLENKVTRIEELLAKDNRRLEALEEGTRTTQKALLALLAHGIDGNEIAALKDAKKELEEYLIRR